MAKANRSKTAKPSAANSPKKGRGTVSRERIERRICELLAEGWTLRQVCSEPGMPSKATVLRWTQGEGPFADHYARAREVGYHSMADELIEIADDGRNDWIEREGRGGQTYIALNDEAVARSKMRIDTRKWLLSKALPKIYGDKHDISLDAKLDINLDEVRSGIADQFARVFAAFDERAGRAAISGKPH
jgi:hypothetical protein